MSNLYVHDLHLVFGVGFFVLFFFFFFFFFFLVASVYKNKRKKRKKEKTGAACTVKESVPVGLRSMHGSEAFGSCFLSQT